MVKGQKYHILYKTTCTVTGNFYMGVHSTTDLEDGYLGSGYRLSRSIKKYGRENHIREILEFFETRENLIKREREVVNEDLLENEKCMNLAKGGEGGFLNREYAAKGGKITGRKNREIARNKFQERLKTDSSFKSKWIENVGKSLLQKTGSKNGWKGRKHSTETIKNMKIKRQGFQSGQKNSQYGTVWIKKENECKKIKKEDLNNFLLDGWKLGRKNKTDRTHGSLVAS